MGIGDRTCVSFCDIQRKSSVSAVVARGPDDNDCECELTHPLAAAFCKAQAHLTFLFLSFLFPTLAATASATV